MCRVLDVSVSGYYQWTQRSESNRSHESRKVKEAIRTIHKENREIYGSPRIAVCLQEQGYRCSRPRTARLMRSMGLRSKALCVNIDVASIEETSHGIFKSSQGRYFKESFAS